MGCHRHLPAPSGFFGVITSVTCLVLLNPSSFHGFCKKAIDKKCHSRGSAFYFQYENGIGLDFLQLGLVGVIKTSGRRQSSIDCDLALMLTMNVLLGVLVSVPFNDA
jgi:hypothetical protein